MSTHIVKPLASLAVVLLSSLIRLASCGGVEGCGIAKTVDDINAPDDDKALARCRDMGRKAQDAGLGDYYAFDVYYDCTKDAGLRK